jgi:hypothetical protein
MNHVSTYRNNKLNVRCQNSATSALSFGTLKGTIFNFSCSFLYRQKRTKKGSFVSLVFTPFKNFVKCDRFSDFLRNFFTVPALLCYFLLAVKKANENLFKHQILFRSCRLRWKVRHQNSATSALHQEVRVKKSKEQEAIPKVLVIAPNGAPFGEIALRYTFRRTAMQGKKAFFVLLLLWTKEQRKYLKADLMYLRSGDLNRAIGYVYTFKTKQERQAKQKE